MAELNPKPFLAESGFLSRVFKGAPAYYAKPDLQQYFDSLEHNLDKHNKVVLGDAVGRVVLLPDSSWNIDKSIYNLHLGVTDPLVLEVGKFKVTFVGGSLDHVDSLVFDGTNLVQPTEPATPPTILENQITNVLLLAKERTITFADDPYKGGIIGPGIPAPLESSDVIEYYDFSLGVFKGLDIPETSNGKLVVCVVAQFTFYFDGFWKPLLIQNFRTNHTNMDISGNKRFPVLNKVLSSFGQFDWINKVMDALNSLALRIDGSNDAITDLYVDKGATGRFKIITREDYASTTQAGIIRIATDVEVFDPTNNSTALSPYGMYLALGSTRKIYEIGVWDMFSTDLISFPHNLGADWVKAVPSACSIRNDAGDSVFTFFNDPNGQFFIDNTYITLHRVGVPFNHADYSDVSVLNRGYVILDLVGVAQTNPLTPPVVNAGADIALDLVSLTYNTPILRSLTKISGAYPTQLGALKGIIEMGAGTENYSVDLQYKRHGNSSSWFTVVTDSNLGQATRTLNNIYVTDTAPPMVGWYNIRARILIGALEIFSNVISVDFTRPTGTDWGNNVTAIIDFNTPDAVAVDDSIGFFLVGYYKGMNFKSLRSGVNEVTISTDKETLCQNYVNAINSDFPELFAVRLGKTAYVSVKFGSAIPIGDIFVFKNVPGGLPIQGTYANADIIPQSTVVGTGSASSYVETTVTGVINSFIGSITNRGWSVVSGPAGSVQQLSATDPNQAIFRFSSVGTWVLRFSATASDGTGTNTGSDLCIVTVSSNVSAIPVVTLRHSDNTTAPKTYPIAGTGNVLLIGSVTDLPTANIQAWEFEYRSMVDENNFLLADWSDWSSLGFNVVPGNPNQTNFFINRPYGPIQFRARVQDTSDTWTTYSNVLEGTIAYTATVNMFEASGTPYLPTTGTIGATPPSTVATGLKFRVRGVITDPNFTTTWNSRTTFLEYDPNNVQTLPSDILNYTKGYSSSDYVANPLTVDANGVGYIWEGIFGTFDCSTQTGRNNLKNSIKYALQNIGLQLGDLANGQWRGNGNFFINVDVVATDVNLGNGIWEIAVNCNVPRGSTQMNETLMTTNPPRLARRVAITGNITETWFI